MTSYSCDIEVSVVIPCLDEADTIGAVVTKARAAFASAGMSGEVVVGDNGSKDRSVEIATRLGARVVIVHARGYGSALMGAIAASRGRFIVMGDADDSYDFGETPKFVARLREGFDLVQGCRLPSGGGAIVPGAMPSLHRWFGNPFLSLLARVMFRVPVNDIYCGMRGFTRPLYDRLGLRCTGMEFATEMIIKSAMFRARIAEVPITLHPDGRKAHGPHLQTFRDGWRTLRFFLMSSPKWLFLIPGVLLVAFGLVGYAVALPGLRVGGVSFDAHTLLVASLALLMGQQALAFASLARTFGMEHGFLPDDPRQRRWLELFTLERGLRVGALLMVAGILLLFGATEAWRATGFGNLDYARTMRLVIPGTTLTALGFQTALYAFLSSILRINSQS
jgi:glycosyltransferase involved in cell wall biosynthesis